MIVTKVSESSSVSKPEHRFLSRSAWLVAFAMFLMFGGMMHDFRSYAMSVEDTAEALFKSGAAFDKDVTAALPERKAAFILAACVTGYCLLTARRQVIWQSITITLLAISSLVWIVMSLAWSVLPSETLRELVRVSLFSALVYGMSVRFTPIEVCKILLVTSALTVLLAVSFAILIGQQVSVDDAYRLGGSLHPNPLARFAMIVAIIALALSRESSAPRWKWITVIVFAMVVIQLTKSRTALASCLAGLAVVFLVGFEFRRFIFPGSVFAVLSAFAIITIGVLGESGIARIGNLATMGRKEKVESLTGRLPLWEALLDHSKDRRMIGFGYGAFWNAKMNDAIQNDRRVSWFPGHAHSCYIELLINIGLIGVSLVTLGGIMAFLRSSVLARKTEQVEYVAFSALLASAFINGITESGFVLPRELAIVSALLVLIVAQQPLNAVASAVMYKSIAASGSAFSRRSYAR